MPSIFGQYKYFCMFGLLIADTKGNWWQQVRAYSVIKFLLWTSYAFENFFFFVFCCSIISFRDPSNEKHKRKTFLKCINAQKVASSRLEFKMEKFGRHVLPENAQDPILFGCYSLFFKTSTAPDKRQTNWLTARDAKFTKNFFLLFT